MGSGTRLTRGGFSAIAIGIAIGMVALTACGGGGSKKGGAAAPSTGSADATATLRYGATQQLLTFDPAKAQAGADQALYMGMVYDTLVALDVSGNPVPDLAASWTQKGLTEYTFTLRTGVTYQDGTAFTAGTAKASLERSIAAAGPRASSLASIGAIEALNPTTLRITLKTPDPDLLNTLASSPAAMLSPQAFSRPNLSTDPDGTGPYTYDAAHSVAGDHYTFTVNPQWWDAANIPRPHSVVFRVLSDDTARLNALKTGQIDIATITAAEVSEAQSSGLKIASRANTWDGLMVLDRQGKTVPALGSPLVRQAMALALNRPALVKALSYGYAVASDEVFAKGTPGYDPSLEGKFAYNPQKAKQLIAQSGFKHITFTAPIAATQQSAAEAIKSELAAVGITMNLQVEPPSSEGALGRSTKFPVLTFPLPNTDPFGRYKALWAPKSGFNPFHVDDPKIDALARQFASATTSAAQNSIAMKINDEVISQGIVVVASQPDDLAAYSPKLKGVNMSTYMVPRLLGIHF